MRPVQYWIDKLQLQPHPEGGFYKETYRSIETIPKTGLPGRFPDLRSFSTAIYFLLRSKDRSLFHRIKSDELWHFHSGTALSIYIVEPPGMAVYRLGDNPENGESLQVCVPANQWFGARLSEENSYALMSCTVAPGFDFADFDLADKQELLHRCPMNRDIIELLTR